MARQNISTGTAANDGTGDTLRSAGLKINENFVELYSALGGDSNTLGNGITFDSTGIIFTNDSSFSVTLGLIDSALMSSKIISLPNKTGEIVVIEEGHGGHHGREIDLADSPNGSAAKIYFGNAFESAGELPNPTVYHGMFAFLHNNGRSVVAHDADGWVNLIDSDTFTTGNYSVTTNATLNSLTLNDPKMNTVIRDSADQAIVQLSTEGTPSNYLKIASTDSSPTIGAEGGTNVGVNIQPKNDGIISFNGRVKYNTQTLSEINNVFDSSAAVYIIDATVDHVFNFFGTGFEVGEVKKIINKSGGNQIDIQWPGGLTYFAHPDAGFGFVRFTGNGYFETIFDGDQWHVSKDSDKLGKFGIG